MRMAALSAIMITALVLLPLAGCAKKENQAPTKNKTTAPTAEKKTKTPSKSPAQASTPAIRPNAGTPAAGADSKAGNPAVTQAPEKITYFSQVLRAWNTGKKGEAVNQFLQLNWQDPTVFQGYPVLSMSEEEFVSLAEGERTRISQLAQQLSQSARDLAQAVIATTDSFMASGNAIGAKARLDAVQQFGQALAGPEHFKIIQLVGTAISQLAQEKLSAVK